MKKLGWMLMVVAVLAAGCKQKPPEEAHVPTQPRTDFTPEEFGIGRAHTKNAACNREIDKLLEPIRLCYNSQPAAACEALQQANSDKVARLKNAAHCRH